MKKQTKKILRLVGGILLAVAVYEITGALLPFIHPQTTSEEFKKNFNPDSFYSDTVSIDRASVVETPMDALNTRIELIHQAKERLILSTFDIREGQSTLDLFSSILEAADRGVTVQILVDGLYGSVHMNGKPIFYALAANPNIEFRFYNIPSLLKPWTINGRMHDKYLIADDKLMLLGGRNTFDYFLGEYNLKKLSYDRDVLVFNTAYGDPSQYPSSVISQTDRYFQEIWASKECKRVYENPPVTMREQLTESTEKLRRHYKNLAAGRPQLTSPDIDYEERTVAINKATLITNPTHIYGKEPWVWYQTQYLMEHAGERAYIQTPYAVLSDDMYHGLREITAHVPDVTMMLNATSVGDNFMASSEYTLSRTDILATGVKLYEYFGDHSSHGKSILIDEDLSLVGSYNLDMRSTYVDTETMLVIDGEEFSDQLERCIRILENDALRVSPDGEYEEKPGVPVIELSQKKRFIFSITSRLFQLIRYLI